MRHEGERGAWLKLALACCVIGSIINTAIDFFIFFLVFYFLPSSLSIVSDLIKGKGV